MMRRGIAILLAVLLSLLLIAPAEAHATLVRSEPPAGALLTTAPKELVLEFSERLDPSFSAVRLLDSKSQVVNAGPGGIDPAAPRVLRLPLAELPKDSYTAVWKVRSADDGHVTEGSVPFGVGVAVTTTALIPPLGAPDPATLPPPPLDSATRWLNLLMAAVALGGLPFALLVWRPAWRAAQRAGADCQPADLAMTHILRRLLIVGGGLFLLTNLLFLVAQAATAAGVPLAQAIGAPLLQLLGGRSGMLWLARIALTLLIGAIALQLPPAGREAAWPWWVALVLGGASLLTISLSSHGAAVPQDAALAIAVDWLHLAAMVAWLGGLVPLAIALRAAQRDSDGALPLATLIPRFSRLAASCIAILTLTGVYNYLLHVNGLDLLAATTYGRALLVKLGLFGVLLLLGGLNLFILSRRLRASSNRLARAFGRSVRGELVVGALLLLAVGVITSVAPSNTAWEEHERQGIAKNATVGDVDMTLQIAPAQIGDNEIAVDVADRRPGAPAAPSKVLLRFNMLGHQMGTLQTEARSSNTQRYSTRGSFLSMGGRWNIEVVLRRAGFDDVRHTFQVDILRSSTDTSFTAPASLARAHAEYILFINTIKQAAVLDLPAVVTKRYLQ
jgi:copper transport protein